VFSYIRDPPPLDFPFDEAYKASANQFSAMKGEELGALPDELFSLKPFGLTTYHAYTQKNSDDSVTHAQLIWKEHEVHAAHKKMFETTVCPDPTRAPDLPTNASPLEL
jgi:hypothetical protein